MEEGLICSILNNQRQGWKSGDFWFFCQKISYTRLRYHPRH